MAGSAGPARARPAPGRGPRARRRIVANPGLRERSLKASLQLARLVEQLATPQGRAELHLATAFALWPVVAPVARLYRATLARRLGLVAVTGSFGKTTTTHAIAAALGLRLRPHTNHSTYLAATLLRTPPWRPHGVIEVGITAPGQMARFAAVLQPDIAVVTSIGGEHRRSLHSLEITRQEKSELVAVLPPHGLALLNGDDPNVRWMRERTAARVLTFGLSQDNDVWASDLRLDWPRGTRFTAHLGDRSFDLRGRLLGRHQVRSFLAALAVARERGLPLEPAVARLEAVEPRPGRLQLLRTPSGVYILRDDYKGAAETTEAALELLSEVPAERRWLVLGDIQEPPHPRGPAFRQLGELAARAATRVLLVGSPEVRRFRTGLLAGGLDPAQVRVLGPSVLEALEQLRREVQPGDVVLLKGRSVQRLERVALGLLGRPVRCDLQICSNRMPRCAACPYLERGWSSGAASS